LPKDKIAVCLTFDDAYFDFYHYVYPLLQLLNIRAVLGIPTQWIQNNTTVDPQTRLKIPYPEGLKSGVQQSHAPLCTWAEIKEMTNSGYVKPASHSDTHASMVGNKTNLIQEIQGSQQALQKKLGMPIDTFIYPFGRMSRGVHKLVRTHYQFGMRIGSAMNKDWHSRSGLLYRIDADHFWQTGQTISKSFIRICQWKAWLNRLRGK
jgi:peptidoglycan/xylan/chitin deacetylase (PgdA/CDA1 family)